MHSPESARRRILSYILVEAGFLLLWAGFICYAFTTFFSIGGASKNTYSGLFTTPTKLNIQIFASRLGEENTKLPETKPQLKTPDSHKNFYTIFPDAGEVVSSLSIFGKGEGIESGKLGINNVYEAIIGGKTSLSIER